MDLPSRELYLSVQDLARLFKTDTATMLADLKLHLGPLRSTAFLPPPLVRKYLVHKGVSIPQQVISLQMLKGGVAKTTSALNIGLRAAMYGARVLFVDLDQQANLTFALGCEDENLPVWVDVVEKRITVAEAIRQVEPGLDLLPSSLNNSVLDRVLLTGNRNWAQSVRAPLATVKDRYDMIVIDTAPNLSAINTAVTCASDLILLPVNPDKFSLLGVRKHLADLNELRTEFGLEFQSKILFTRYDGREAASREILSQCIAEFEDLLLKSYIRTSTEIKNSIGTVKSIFNSKSNAKDDYDMVTQEVLEFTNAIHL